MYWVNRSHTEYLVGNSLLCSDTVDLAIHLNYSAYRPRENNYGKKCAFIEYAFEHLDVDALVFRRAPRPG